MGAELGRYVWWWIDDHKRSRLVFVVPLLLVTGPWGAVASAVHGEFSLALGFVGFMLLALLALFGSFVRRDRLNAPWNTPPRHDPTGKTRPWSSR